MTKGLNGALYFEGDGVIYMYRLLVERADGCRRRWQKSERRTADGGRRRLGLEIAAPFGEAGQGRRTADGGRRTAADVRAQIGRAHV